MNATENEQKSPKGNSHICTPSKQDNPPCRFNVRSSNGRFAKSKEKDIRAEQHCKKLKEGFKSWAAKRKLEFENSSDENQPPSKRLARAAEVRFEMQDPFLILLCLVTRELTRFFIVL